MMMTCSNAERAADLMAEVDALWARCERGISLVYPGDDRNPAKQQRAARLLVTLMDEAKECEREAMTLDPGAVAAWAAKREALYQERGWAWPPDPVAASEERLTLVQMAWATE
jgi:hypothetical protein